VPVAPAAYANTSGDIVLRDRVLRLSLAGSAQASIEVIRFASANHLCIDLDYRKLDGSITHPRIEAYSLRRTADGNIVLHGYDVNKQGHRSYRVDLIRDARVSNQTFIPRYEIELTPRGPLHVAPTTARATGLVQRHKPLRAAKAPARARLNAGPTFVVQCPVCQKKFSRKTNTNQLNPHKNEHGYKCSGRHGIYVETRY
jgi:WYL domain